MLRNIKHVPSKRPKRWKTRSVYELTCDHCNVEFERSYTNQSVLTSKHFCSRKCKHASQSDGVMAQTVQNPFTRDDVKLKIRQTNLDRYGVEHASQSDEVKARTTKTWQERLGVSAPMQSPDVLKKARVSCEARYGVDWASKSSQIREQIRQTNMEHYGVHCTLLDPGVVARCKQTNVKRYGMDHPGWMFAVTKHKRGHIETPWGTFWYRSSWEEAFLKWCIQHAIYVTPNVSIAYVYDGRDCVYYADFLVTLEVGHVLCEVKPSKLKLLPKNVTKHHAATEWCTTRGFSFRYVDEHVLGWLGAAI